MLRRYYIIFLDNRRLIGNKRRGKIAKRSSKESRRGIVARKDSRKERRESIFKERS